jgi:hypothetical protein
MDRRRFGSGVGHGVQAAFGSLNEHRRIDGQFHLALVLTGAVNACSGSDVTVTRLDRNEPPATDDSLAPERNLVVRARAVCPRPGQAPLERALGVARQPYLQSVTADSAVIALTLYDASAAPRLTFVDAPSGQARELESQVDPADATGMQRIVRLTSLEPDTVYVISCRDGRSRSPFERRRAPARVEACALPRSGIPAAVLAIS